jgi:uncharacterized protein involved in exopolysaccharide biosynthesis
MRYLRTLLRHWALYVIPLLVLPVIMTAYGYVTLRTYQSQANLIFERPSFLPSVGIEWDTSQTPAQNQAGAINQMLQTRGFMMGIAARTDLAAVYKLKTQAGQDAAIARLTDDLNVQAGKGPDLIVVTANDRMPRIAQQAARALIDQYAAYYAENRLTDDQNDIKFFTDQATQARNYLTVDNQRIDQFMRDHPETTAQAELDPQLATMRQAQAQDQSTLDTFTKLLKGAQVDAQATSAAGPLFTVADAPSAPQSKLAKRKLFLDTGIGFGIALALVVGIVVFLTRRDRHVYFAQDLVAIGDELDWDLPAVQHFPILKELFLPPDAKKVIGDGDDASGPFLDGVAPVGV